MKILLIAILLTVFVGCGGGGHHTTKPPVVVTSDPWQMSTVSEDEAGIIILNVARAAQMPTTNPDTGSGLTMKNLPGFVGHITGYPSSRSR